MSKRCICSNVSLSQWRHEIYSQLFAVHPTATHGPRLQFLRPTKHRVNERRHISTKPPRSASKDGRPKRASNTPQDFPGKSRPLDSESAQNTFNEGFETGAEDPTSNSPLRTQQRFDPNSPEHRDELRRVVDSLRDLHKDLEEQQQQDVEHKSMVRDAGMRPEEQETTYHRVNLKTRPTPLQSPVSRHAAQDNKASLLGRKVMPPDTTQLDQDPYASILCREIRQCSASTVRVSDPLLTRFVVVENDGEGGDGQSYLVPKELADSTKIEEVVMKTYQKKVEWLIKKARVSAEFASPDNESGHAKEDPASPALNDKSAEQETSHLDSNPSADQENPKSPPSHHRPSLQPFQPAPRELETRILPHLQLNRLITTKTTRMNITKVHRGKKDPSSVAAVDNPLEPPLEPIPGSTAPILGLGPRLKTARARQFEAHRSDVATRTQQRKQIALPDNTMLVLDGILWQPEMASRMLRILRERVLVGLRLVLEDHLRWVRQDGEGVVQRIGFVRGDVGGSGAVVAAKTGGGEDREERANEAEGMTEHDRQNSSSSSSKATAIRTLLHLEGPYPWTSGEEEEATTFSSPTTARSPNSSSRNSNHSVITTTFIDKPNPKQFLPAFIPASTNSLNRAPVFPLHILLGPSGIARLKSELAHLLRAGPRQIRLKAYTLKSGETVNEQALREALFNGNEMLDREAYGSGEAAVGRRCAKIDLFPPPRHHHQRRKHDGGAAEQLLEVLERRQHSPSSPATLSLLLRLNARNTTALLEDLWTLWRYVGGRDAFSYSDNGALDLADDEDLWVDPRIAAWRVAQRAVRMRREEGDKGRDREGVGEGGGREEDYGGSSSSQQDSVRFEPLGEM